MKVESLEQLKELKMKLATTKEQIKKYSIYNMDDIGETIAKVITAFEGIEYISVRYNYNIDEDYFYKYVLNQKKLYKNDYHTIHIIPKEQVGEEYSRYRIVYKRDQDDKNICYLPPAYYTPHKKCYYIKDFLNFLYTKKVESNRDDKDLYIATAEKFIRENQDEIAKRQNMIEETKNKKKKPEKKIEMRWRKIKLY